MQQITEKPSDERSVMILLHLLRNRNRKFTVTDIENWLNQDEMVTKRSVQRSMQKLVNARGTVVVEERHGREKRYSIQPDFRWNIEVPIDKNSVLALFLLKRLQPFFATDKRLYDDLSAMLRKIGGDLDDEIFEELDSQLDEHVEIMGERALTHLQGETLDALLTAVVKKHRCTLQYQNTSGAIREHDVCPVRFLMAENELYLAAVYNEQEPTAYYFKLCRIMGVTRQATTFSLSPEQISAIKQRFLQSFGLLDNADAAAEEVVLEFPSWYSRILSERRIHASQTHSVKEDGTTVLTLTAPVGPDLVQWVLSKAEIVKIVGPESLRLRVAEVMEKFLVRNQER